MLFAMMKQLTVVAEPSITRSATICSPLNPKLTATGMKMATSRNNLMKVAVRAGFTSFAAFLKSKVAPIDISPRGVASFARLFIIDSPILGIGI